MTLHLYAGDPEGRMHSGNPTVHTEVKEGNFIELRAALRNRWGNEEDVSLSVYVDGVMYRMQTPLRIGVMEATFLTSEEE